MITHINPAIVYGISALSFLLDLCTIHLLEQSTTQAVICFFIISALNYPDSLTLGTMYIFLALEHFLYHGNFFAAFAQTTLVLSWLLYIRSIINKSYIPFYYAALIICLCIQQTCDFLFLNHATLFSSYTIYKIIANIIILTVLLKYINPQVD